MKPFVLEPGMLTMGGVFYPTGHMFLMFPSRDDAAKASQALLDNGYSGESISFVTPEQIRDNIARTIGDADMQMPSAGTEADTVRMYSQLASQGHHALMVHAPKAEQSEHVMDLLQSHPISYAQKYRRLVIEDLA
ncbi:RNA-binding protein [uncultured Ramlibacter sp.]|uniref:RNA-binding protein n=1 Tax=uncultured Ramlibacter sp. TaxID=260755 RepID=UPI00260FA5E2|nr:RNA-binding protein [uncultured Ramlibacter sp.]